jgi:hypothetical protein
MPAVAMFDPPAVPFEGGSRLLFTAAAPNTRQGHSLQTPSLYREPLPFQFRRAFRRCSQLLEPAEVYSCVSGWL